MSNVTLTNKNDGSEITDAAVMLATGLELIEKGLQASKNGSQAAVSMALVRVATQLFEAAMEAATPDLRKTVERQARLALAAQMPVHLTRRMVDPNTDEPTGDSITYAIPWAQAAEQFGLDPPKWA